MPQCHSFERYPEPIAKDCSSVLSVHALSTSFGAQLPLLIWLTPLHPSNSQRLLSPLRSHFMIQWASSKVAFLSAPLIPHVYLATLLLIHSYFTIYVLLISVPQCLAYSYGRPFTESMRLSSFFSHGITDLSGKMCSVLILPRSA